MGLHAASRAAKCREVTPRGLIPWPLCPRELSLCLRKSRCAPSTSPENAKMSCPRPLLPVTGNLGGFWSRDFHRRLSCWDASVV
ncbi:hypothetical protein NN561_020349 [Cricetulus griseus]